MKRKKDVTMQDIADYLSVSKVTVSKALNGKEGVGTQLRERILEASRMLNYRPSPNTRGIPARTGNIAVLMKEKFAHGEAGFYLRFYQRISIELNARGYSVRLFPLDSKSGMGGQIFPFPGQYDIEGVILLGEVERELLDSLAHTRFPCVLVDTCDDGFKLDCVVTESMYTVYELTTYLMDCGHTEIGFVGTVTATDSIMDRYMGFCRAHLKRGLPIRSDWIIGDRNGDGEEVKFTLPEQMPTAFVCNCDDTAYQFVRILNEKGYRVPEDISIVSFDNDIHAQLCVPKLTTAEVDINQMAGKAVELICEKIDQGKESSGSVTFVNAKILYRDSVKKLKS